MFWPWPKKRPVGHVYSPPRLADIVSPETRSRMMSGIRGKNTKPELSLRQGLHRLGLCYSLHSSLPGKPDIVLPKWRTVVFFHGCFWHGHDCSLFRLPSTRTDFWREKIDSNRRRDARVASELLSTSWRVAVVRECSIRGARKRSWEAVCRELGDWIKGDPDARYLEISALDR